MRTAIYLGCVWIACAINPELELTLSIRILNGLVIVLFTLADTYEFMVKNFKKK